MRFFKGLFMLLIGMIGFTAMATTPLTEQKQKTELVKVYTTQTIVGNVVVSADLVFVVNNDSVASVPNDLFLQKVNVPLTTLAIITDVGWRVSRQHYKQIPYTKKLLDNCNLQYRQSATNTENRIRNDC